MSDPGVPPGPQQPPSTQSAPASEIPLWVIFVAIAVMISLAVTAGLMLVANDPASPTYPKHWDARVAPYAKVAEKKRGLPFKHPVPVRFLTAAEFETTVTADKKKLNADDRTELRHFAGLMRAFGLMTGNVDLFAAFNTFSVSGTLAYYSFDDKTITIRGSKLTAASRATLVHELTHALQDQYFDIGDRMEKLRKDSGSGWSTAEYAVLDAIIEGDAERVAGRYRASLSAKKRRALDAGQKDEFTRANKDLKRVPKVVVTMMTSPYVLGEGLVQAVAASGGNTEVDDLFRHPPAHESSLLDPFEVLAGHTSADKVDVPAVRAGEKKFDSGELGVLTWYLMLAERLPLRDALAAADGWGGDAYVAFERHGESCVRTTYRGRTKGAGKQTFSALRRWVAAAPGSPAAVRRNGATVSFESCDPGTSARVGNDASQDAVGLVATRANLGVALLRSGAPESAAHCLSGRLVRAFSVKQLTDPTFGTNDPDVRTRIQQLAAGCR